MLWVISMSCLVPLQTEGELIHFSGLRENSNPKADYAGSTPGDVLWIHCFGLERDFMNSTCTGSLAVLAATLVLTVSAEQVQGSVVVFNSQQGYDLVAPTFGIETTDYSLETFNGFYSSISGGQDETAWSIDASSGVEGTFGEWITSAGLNEALNDRFCKQLRLFRRRYLSHRRRSESIDLGHHASHPFRRNHLHQSA